MNILMWLFIAACVVVGLYTEDRISDAHEMAAYQCGKLAGAGIRAELINGQTDAPLACAAIEERVRDKAADEINR